MINSDSILVLDKNDKPIGPITKLELVIEAGSPALTCIIYKAGATPAATLLESYTVRTIFQDFATEEVIIKLN
jgi:hypothetical protein